MLADFATLVFLERVELPARRLFSWLNKAWVKTLEDIGKEGVPITWGGDDDLTLAREPYKELFQSFYINPARVIFERKSLAIAGRAQSWRSQVAP